MQELKQAIQDQSQTLKQSTQNTGQFPEIPKRSNRIIIVCAAVLFVLLITAGIGAGIYLILKTKEEAPSEPDEVQDLVQDPYEGWKLYENEDYGFSFQYPSYWELTDTLDECDEDEEYWMCGLIVVEKDNYVWRLEIDPVYTGGGWGYLFDAVFPPSVSEESTVSPAGYDSDMVTYYYSSSEAKSYYEEGGLNWDFGDNAWGNSVLFRKADESTGIDIAIPGFGPGDAYDDISGSYFSIIYTYNSQEDDYSDLPQKGDDKLKGMLEIMDKITNSFELKAEENAEDAPTVESQGVEGWKTYTSPVYGYTVNYPSDWELNESEEIVCPGQEGEGGCYPRSKGATVEIRKRGSGNKLQIEYPVGFASYAFDKDKNYEEEKMTFWGQSNKKGFVYCDLKASPVDCIKEKYSEVAITFYHDGLDERAEACSSCYYPEDNLEDACGERINIIGRFYGGYTEEEDGIYDQIVSLMTAPSCGE
ncbi:hypothetical protein JW766_05845 [Candidatus Dojkabacteria bacterium]|nr:hypothetical protein [Candidatus Dojkabacteria bacterium]